MSTNLESGPVVSEVVDLNAVRAVRALDPDLERARKARADAAEAKATKAKCDAEIAELKLADKTKKEERPAKWKLPPGAWDLYKHAQADAEGRPYSNLRNAYAALCCAPWNQVFLFDELAASVVVVRPIPAFSDPDQVKEKIAPRQLTEADVGAVQLWLQELGLVHVSPQVTAQAVEMAGRRKSYHPIRRMLKNLPEWDGTPRCQQWLVKTFGADDTEYTREIGLMFLVAMIKRVFEPGAKADYMLVLEGLQGIKKSSTLKILAGEEYFTDTFPEKITSKEASQSLRGMWLIEAPEMSTLSKSQVDDLKAFISRTTEHYRPTYGKAFIKEPRQCVFAGTTNRSQYLKDETGNRRFWPIHCTKVDQEWLVQNRDQLLAEALIGYELGVQSWPSSEFEETHIKPQQEARRTPDPWEALIEDWLRNGRTELSEKGTNLITVPIVQITPGEIMTECLRIPPERQNGNHPGKVTGILENRLKWRRLDEGKKRRHQAFVPPSDWNQ
ncbi:MAG: virulence-associated E family protein [Rhodospirillaceae bacterium]